MRLLAKNEVIILSVMIMTVIVAVVVIILLMCRLRRGRPIQRFTIQHTPSAYVRADVIRIRSVDSVGYSMS